MQRFVEALFGRFKMKCGNYTGTVSHVLCREVVLFGRFKMYCRNYTGTVSHVLCREVYYTVSLFGRVHYCRFHSSQIQADNTITV